MRKFLSLTGKVASVVETAFHVVSSIVPPQEISLGGGTALEARWRHRLSTDLDFFSHGEGTDLTFYEDLDKVVACLKEWESKGVIQLQKDGAFAVRPNSPITFHVDGVPITLTRSKPFDSQSNEVEKRSGASLSPVRDILAKKLFHRVWEKRILTVRDAYDFAVSATQSPEELRFAWDQLPQHAREVVVHDYGVGVKSNSPPLLSPQDERLAKNVWEETHRMFFSNLAYTPRYAPQANIHQK